MSVPTRRSPEVSGSLTRSPVLGPGEAAPCSACAPSTSTTTCAARNDAAVALASPVTTASMLVASPTESVSRRTAECGSRLSPYMRPLEQSLQPAAQGKQKDREACGDHPAPSRSAGHRPAG